ncbi:hypothetical protein ACQB6R_02805 [Propionibacteriaceae bacterium G1746]|uniref:hypothetical protein n=1 Tax=Aestuariimicrobium sp. G57 TaxID=3418485 RepID=UPI003C13AB35
MIPPRHALVAAGLALALLGGCTGGGSTGDSSTGSQSTESQSGSPAELPPTDPREADLRAQLEARVKELGADGVSAVSVTADDAGLTVRKGSDQRTYRLTGSTEGNPDTGYYYGIKPVPELSLKNLLAAQTAAAEACDGVPAIAELEVTPAGSVVITGRCLRDQPTVSDIISQTLDGFDVPVLADGDTAEGLNAVFEQFMTTHGGQLAGVSIAYIPGGTMGAAVFSADAVKLNGEHCLPVLDWHTRHKHGQGLTMPCASGDTGAGKSFDVSELAPRKVASALTAIYREVPRASMRSAQVTLTDAGFRIVVTAESGVSTWTLDGQRV